MPGASDDDDSASRLYEDAAGGNHVRPGTPFFCDEGQGDEDVDDGQEVAEKLEGDLKNSDVNYYAVLNVSKTATEDEIKESYKRLCRTFHPDKHVDPEDKKTAEQKFQVIQRAYEVLTNPINRTAYDLYGEEGLKISREVGPLLKTPDQIREEYERQARLKREQELENLVKSKATIQLDLDATQVVDPYSSPDEHVGIWHRVSQTELRQLTLNHSWNTPLGPNTSATITGHMISRNGVGTGNLLGTVRHTFSPKLLTEGTITLLAPRGLQLRTLYHVSTDSFLQLYGTLQSMNQPPRLNLTAGRRLTANATGYIGYRTGEWALGSWGRRQLSSRQRREYSSVAVGVSTQKGKSNHTVELVVGLASSHIMFHYNRKVNKDLDMQIAADLSTAGVKASLGADRKVTENAKLGVAVSIGLPEGVTLKLRLTRLGQKLVLPVVLCRELALDVVFWALLLPTCFGILLEQAVLRPRKMRLIKQRISELRELHAEHLAARRQEALDAQRLMRETVARKAEQEAAKNGLVILEAVYGNLASSETTFDVTTAVQALVYNSQLRIPGGLPKSNIIGFCDPCLGEAKRLRIRYRFQGKFHEIEVDDKAGVAAPLRSHLLE